MFAWYAYPLNFFSTSLQLRPTSEKLYQIRAMPASIFFTSAKN